MSSGTFGGGAAMPAPRWKKEEAKPMPMTREKRAQLSRLVTKLERELRTVPELRRHQDWVAIDKATAAIVARLEREEGAYYGHTREHGGTHHFRMGGVKAISSGPQLKVLQNWVAKVRKRISKDLAA